MLALPFLALVLALPAPPNAYVDWVRPYESNNYDTAGHAVVTDGAGCTYVAGLCADHPDTSDILTIKYDRHGRVLWTAVYDGPAGHRDTAFDIALDTAGNVHVAGMSMGVGMSEDAIMIKYAPDGTLQWVYRQSGPSGASLKSLGQISIDGAGNVYAAGTFQDTGTGNEAVLLKLDATGKREWIHRVNSGMYGDAGVDVRIAPDGSVRFLYRYGLYGYGGDSRVDCLTPAGTVVWTTVLPMRARGLDIDAASNVYVAGDAFGTSTFTDWLTLKVNAAGTIEWTDTFDGLGSLDDYAMAISASPTGEVYVTGTISKSIGTTSDFATVKYGTSGVRDWARVFDGGLNKSDSGQDVVWHPTGGCVVTGTGVLPDIPFGSVTMRYDAGGTRVWLEAWDQGNGMAVALDRDDNVVVTGHMPYRSLTIKYRTDLLSPVEILIVPETQPLEIPNTGGAIDYQTRLRNNTASQRSFSAGTYLVFPGPSLIGPLRYHSTIVLTPNETLSSQPSQTVPAGLPAGDYTYLALIGKGGIPVDRSWFFFTKLP